MRVDDAHHVRPLPVHPQVKPRGRVGERYAVQRPQVIVDQDQVRLCRLVRAYAELERPVGASLLAARADLPGQPAVPVALRTQHAAGQDEALLQRSAVQLYFAGDFTVYRFAGGGFVFHIRGFLVSVGRQGGIHEAETVNLLTKFDFNKE